MNAKQRKQAERVAAYARQLSEASVKKSDEALAKMEAESLKLNELRDEVNLPFMLVELKETLSLLATEKAEIFYARNLEELEREGFVLKAEIETLRLSLKNEEAAIRMSRRVLQKDREALEFNNKVFQAGSKDQLEELQQKRAAIIAANQPVLDVIKDILLQLDLDEEPGVIGSKIRKIYDIMEAKW